jgi:uncharacterized membrane protein
MDDVTLIALGGAALVGLLAAVTLMRREQRAEAAAAAGSEPMYAVSTEGMKRCPSCGMGNLVTDRNCSSCGKRLPG